MENREVIVQGTVVSAKVTITIDFEAGTIKAEEEKAKEVDLKEVMERSIKRVEEIAEEKGMESEYSCPSIPSKVYGGPLLEQVFYNIIENAVHHSEGTKIKIYGETTEEEVICVIEDDGNGIPDDKKGRILDKGYTTDEERGTGLGMFLVSKLLEIYEGKIEIKDSNLGGARFDVHLKKA